MSFKGAGIWLALFLSRMPGPVSRRLPEVCSSNVSWKFAAFGVMNGTN